MLSFIGCIAIMIKYYFEVVWKDFKQQATFSKVIFKKLAESGNFDLDPAKVKEHYQKKIHKNFNNQVISQMAKNYAFWMEIVLMMVVPLPLKVRTTIMKEHIITMHSINWVDNSGQHPAQSHIYATPYHSCDFYLAFMFFRIYFLACGLLQFSPVNKNLYGRRVCHNAGVDHTLSFQIKASFHKNPITTYLVIATTLILSLAYTLRIFERPYYAFNFTEASEIHFMNFQYFSSSLWYVIVTMSSVGYGDMIASTPIGRCIAITSIIVGAVLLATMVSLITGWLNMEE